MSPSQGYLKFSTGGFTNIFSHRASLLMIPSGVYFSASQKARMSSSVRPALSMSLGSLSGNFMMCSLPKLKIPLTSSTASCPAASASKQTTTFSNPSSHSRLALNVFLAALAPLGRETTGHLFPCTCDIVSASISPSVITRGLPLDQWCWFQNSLGSLPRTLNCLPC